MRRCWLRAEAGASVGLGHLMRSVALLEAAEAHGFAPVVVADVDAAVREGVRTAFADVRWLPTAGEDWISELSPGDLIVLDGVQDPGRLVAASAARGGSVLLVDEGPAPAPAGTTLRVAPDWDAEQPAVHQPELLVLAGPEHALVRSQVLEHRRRRSLDGETLAILLGGTDVAGGTTAVARHALDAGFRRLLVVLGPHAAIAPELDADERVEVHRSPTSVPAVLDEADAAVVAGGNSAWEVCCLGLPAAVMAVVPDQVRTVELLARAGAAIPLGAEPAERLPGALAQLRRQEVRRSIADAAWSIVDGLGGGRVVARALAPAEAARR